MPQEKEVMLAYKVIRYTDGTIDVVNSPEDGSQVNPSLEDLYSDVEELAREIERNKIERAAYIGASEALRRLFAEISAKKTGEDEANI